MLAPFTWVAACASIPARSTVRPLLSVRENAGAVWACRYAVSATVKARHQSRCRASTSACEGASAGGPAVDAALAQAVRKKGRSSENGRGQGRVIEAPQEVGFRAASMPPGGELQVR